MGNDLHNFTLRQILGGLYTPLDGHVDPYSLTQAIAAGARKRGAKIEQRTEVKALELGEDGKWRIKTGRGEITADRVVNTAGLRLEDFVLAATFLRGQLAIKLLYSDA